MKLSARSVATIQLPFGKAEHFEFDDEIPGLALRLRAGGSRTLIFQYRFGTKNRRLSLGPALPEGIAAARKRAAELLLQVRSGVDPAALKEAAVVAAKQQQAESFKAVADLYIARQEKAVRGKTLQEAKRYLLVTAKPLHNRPIASVTRRDIAELLTVTETGVTKGTGASTANLLRATLSAMLSWAMREGLVEANPAMNTNKREQQSRKRVLPMSELAEIWRSLPDDNFGAAMKLLMLTAQRRHEIGGLRWSELDEDLSRITLPPERQKNDGGPDRLNHVVPLSGPAREILSKAYRIVGWKCVFSAANGIGSWGHSKADLDANLPHLAHWTIHDIRRSVATHMADDLGVLPHVIEAALNHYSGSKAGVAGIYNHARYLKEVTQALTLWAEHLMATVSGKPAKVIPLRIA